jgi:hypothetical protein
MNSALSLRRRILAALALTACSSERAPGPEAPTATIAPSPAPTDVEPIVPVPAPEPPMASCGGAPAAEECYEANSDMRHPGMVAHPRPLPAPTFDANGCMSQAEVQNGCCNPAVGGPRFTSGQCCYQFCPGACCGRPFLVGDETRHAPTAARADWCADLPVGSRDEALARAWLDDALAEHASIASFARFTLELLAHGAPSALVAAAQQAAADEVEHARLCFALARRYGGEALGPGPLDLTGVSLGGSLGDAVLAAFREGCVGETLAALVAAEQLRVATDPEARACLARIAEDEARHAELAWRFVAWALPRLSPAERALLVIPREVADIDDVRLEARREIVAAGLREVVAPCLAALLAGEAAFRRETLAHA